MVPLVVKTVKQPGDELHKKEFHDCLVMVCDPASRKNDKMFPFERDMNQSFHLSLVRAHKNQGTDSVHGTGVQLITKVGRLQLDQRWDEFQVLTVDPEDSA